VLSSNLVWLSFERALNNIVVMKELSMMTTTDDKKLCRFGLSFVVRCLLVCMRERRQGGK
jgi:hypothetical protein